LRRAWTAQLVETYGLLDGDGLEARLRRAEAWLDTHPHDATLLLTLGRISARLQLYGKARQYLQRSLTLAPAAAAWEVLGDVFAGLQQPVPAQRCYRAALLAGRGEPLAPVAEVVRQDAPDTHPVAWEQRDEHGVPRLMAEKQEQ
jgi:HemY protein